MSLLEVIQDLPHETKATIFVLGSIYALTKVLKIGAYSQIFEEQGHYYKVELKVNDEVDHILTQEFIKQGDIVLYYLGTSPWYKLGSLDIARALMGSNISSRYETRLSPDHSKKVVVKATIAAQDLARKHRVDRLRIKANHTHYHLSYIRYLKHNPAVRSELIGEHTVLQNKPLCVGKNQITFDGKIYSYDAFLKHAEYIGWSLIEALACRLSSCYSKHKLPSLRYFRQAEQKLQLGDRNNTSHHARMRLYMQHIRHIIPNNRFVEHDGTAYIYLT